MIYIGLLRRKRMYKKLLVPLDGSYISEAALDHALIIARGCHVSELYLLTVVEPFRKRFTMVNEEWIGGVIRESAVIAQNYLDQMVMKLKSEGLPVIPVVVEGDPAERILKYASENDIDLIIITSHGRSEARRWVFGSVAQKIVQNSSTPVIMVPARNLQDRSILSMAD
jgi:nucleotide-binding universal stress UspA family protein